MEPVIQNIVCTCNLGSTIYLPFLVRSLPSAEYNNKRFAAVTTRLVKPKATALFFGSGKVVCTGTRTKNAARLALRKFVRMVRSVDLEVGMYNFVIQNVVASAKLSHLVNLGALRERCGACASYEPELFPGMVYRPDNSHIVFLIFSSGRTVITGAKNEREVLAAFKRMKRLFATFGRSIVATTATEGRGCKNRDLRLVLSHPSVVEGSVEGVRALRSS